MDDDVVDVLFSMPWATLVILGFCTSVGTFFCLNLVSCEMRKERWIREYATFALLCEGGV